MCFKKIPKLLAIVLLIGVFIRALLQISTVNRVQDDSDYNKTLRWSQFQSQRKKSTHNFKTIWKQSHWIKNIPGNVSRSKNPTKSQNNFEDTLFLDPNVPLDSKKIKFYSAHHVNQSLKHFKNVKASRMLYRTDKKHSTTKIKSTMPLATENTTVRLTDAQREGMETQVIHRKYWEAVKMNKNEPLPEILQNQIVIQSQSNNQKSLLLTDKEILDGIYGRNLKSPFLNEPQKYMKSAQKRGSGKNDDHRMLAQSLWQMEAHNLLPNLFNKSAHRVKRISLMENSTWWGYKGVYSVPHLLSCAGGLNKKCELAFNDGVDADVIVTPNDYIHEGRWENYTASKDIFHIHYSLESPLASFPVYLNRPRDLLASYWRGSDIQVPYGKWLYYDPRVTHLNQSRNYAAGKSKMVAIFLSHCRAENRRQRYVKNLRRYISVDVYGSCGTQKCEKSQACFDMLKSDYRFYLSFENANCRDYITEKFFVNALQNDVIPIVLGAHPDDYRAAAPRDSYIHVEDFKTPRDLAVYLKHLAQNEADYNKYFQWKGTGELVTSDFFCRVCGMLYYAGAYPLQTRAPLNESLHSADKMCLRKGKWFWKK